MENPVVSKIIELLEERCKDAFSGLTGSNSSFNRMYVDGSDVCPTTFMIFFKVECLGSIVHIA